VPWTEPRPHFSCREMEFLEARVYYVLTPWNQKMTEQTLYWLFSTVAQTLGAIVGIIGMLTVYRLQNIPNQKRQIMEDSSSYRQYFFGLAAKSQTPEKSAEDWPKKKRPEEIDTKKRGSSLHSLHSCGFSSQKSISKGKSLL